VTADDAAFAALAKQIAQTSGFAVDAYKDKCIRRRIAVRMRACGVHTYDDYRALLNHSPAEYERLRDALTINVTRFYRNAETWNLLRRIVLPVLFDRPRVDVRVWSAGCASGEEPYTLAALAASYLDQMGRGGELARLTIDATDIDRASLDRARDATYRREGLTEMPPDLVRKYFEPGDKTQRVIDRVRRRVHVRLLDLSREAPLRTDYDLILCRNVVIYFERPTQERLFRTFAEALVPGGFLVLGKVETLFGSARDYLALMDPRERLYRRPA
jgi:chemotaxis protein methyltransferase CheR